MLKAIFAAALLLTTATISSNPVSAVKPKSDNELTITITGQEPWYPVYDRVRRSFTVRAQVEHLGVPQPDATITFTVYDPRGNVADGDSITRLTDANGGMTCTHYFINSARRGTYTLLVEVEKDGLTGSAEAFIEYLK